ncbi:class I SAM-dependent methyltransferase [Candidatus Parabeggiatoa sp. HSG14]|uniref:class I SAM-dependent methyltransferase n=1 Tax=Candidatus Parabeggiatoa sp. HSG14 TaxID=3055593 RepID=UPI0025A82FA4|nr:class I SAM-dependent methyltransferase [Thiotrichales bacterium HSG14]
MLNKTLQQSYTLLSPLYDSVVALPTRIARQRSLAQLGDVQGMKILLCGIGTGLDIPYLPKGANYTGIDFTYAMLKRAKQPITTQDVNLHQGNVMQLPYPDHCFDVVIMHLILAVVPDSQKALDEATRVLAPNGKILILDKFLKPKQRAFVRRLLSPLISKIATRTDVVFEDLSHPTLTVVSNTAALANGWFRQILMKK